MHFHTHLTKSNDTAKTRLCFVFRCQDFSNQTEPPFLEMFILKILLLRIMAELVKPVPSLCSSVFPRPVFCNALLVSFQRRELATSATSSASTINAFCQSTCAMETTIAATEATNKTAVSVTFPCTSGREWFCYLYSFFQEVSCIC